MKDDPIFIITLGHTGSSSFAELLMKLGLPIYNPYSDNVRDYYENSDLIAENKRLIGNDQKVVDRSRITGRPRTDLKGLLKDPRTVITFPLWYRAYPQAKWIFFTRNLYDTVIDKFVFWKQPKVVEQRLRFFYESLQMCDRKIYVHYDNLSFDFERTMKYIAEFCEVPYQPVTGWKPKYCRQHYER